ncbi:mitochondrial 54S ribosomal protein YmL41 [Friedmanniomyces endolithicus]|uniref:Large ribosomal subunit protein uL23m n=1 Tax=Friedmanniomyces endolithicus TaxID=329885 RepID=A0AAN6JXW9_9PEZI|nr:mitochondrial 54S ribosomal protein YmL41 [Friedmanniomyces endolithicus]KAK0788700.1 mitochondrial 54S ribosomal protein YmL41 [Friedmanniomyces endolithicus]KAK0806582.1 mitochondrial 54S ribosomal protein YmL41 [Friedmanniomyces endolithicus]KAK0817458.1 mitochondrial 54S ribosomal protein YmL41 [Friedmanniomyces endolithicus]KAK0837944.1 mitochondrial 54S ribosomal protein YmL41 [Friedmanniomyces endolithicus]
MATGALFKVGQKELYLPNFEIIFKRTPSQPPTSATFLVPLWFSKLDLRDYLYHAYSLTIGASIRSYVQQSRIRQGQTPDPVRPQYKRWHRPRATKRMTVELDRPFVWPEEPESYTPWNKEETKMANEDQMEYQRRQGGDRDALAVPDERRVKMREQARALLEGKQTWRPGGGRMAEGIGMYGRR